MGIGVTTGGSAPTDRVTILGTGKMGIGTTNPAHTLDVAGDVNLTGDFSFDASSTVVSSIKDEDNMSSDSATALATQQSIKAYVDSQVGASSLDVTDAAGNTTSVGLNSHDLVIVGTSGEVDVAIADSSGNAQVTIGLPNDVTLTGDLTVNGGDIVMATGGTLTFEGASADAHETTLAVTNPTADRTITLPDITGTVVTDADVLAEELTGTGTSGNVLSPTIEVSIIQAGGTATYTLADGTRLGFRKKILSVSGSNAITITPANYINFTSSVLNANGEYIELMWVGGARGGWIKYTGYGDDTA